MDDEDTREMIKETFQTLEEEDGILEESEQNRQEDIKRQFERYIKQCGLPANSLYNESTLKEIAKTADIAYQEEEELLEAIDMILEDEESIVSEIVENNLKYFGELD